MSTSPIVYGIPDNLAMYSDSGDSFSVSASVGGGARRRWRRGRRRRGGGRGGGAGRPADRTRARPTIRTSSRGVPALEATQPVAAAAAGDGAAVAVCAADRRAVEAQSGDAHPAAVPPRVAVRFDAQNTLLVSGLLDGGADIAQRPVVVDVPVGKGHVVLFANNPIWRGETIGSYFMVFNTILNFDSLNAGRVLDSK